MCAKTEENASHGSYQRPAYGYRQKSFRQEKGRHPDAPSLQPSPGGALLGIVLLLSIVVRFVVTIQFVVGVEVAFDLGLAVLAFGGMGSQRIKKLGAGPETRRGVL